MGDMNKIILDADGVFFAERPYWNAALATAFGMSGLSASVNGGWQKLTDDAFTLLDLQTVTKYRGCNSNWDLASVLAKALECRSVCGAVQSHIEAKRTTKAVETLYGAAQSLWSDARIKPARRNGKPNVSDPLNGFGISRTDKHFRDTVNWFQCTLNGPDYPDLCFDRSTLKESYPATSRAFAQFQAAGYEIRVCTGRHHAEIDEPVARAGLRTFLPASVITSADEVDKAQALTQKPSLGKPHWFAPTCAAIGFYTALACLKGKPLPTITERLVYVGDALADYRAVAACNEIGLKMNYVHIRSGITSPEQEEEIADARQTLGIVNRLEEINRLLESSGK